jgi:hypothetical protein
MSMFIALDLDGLIACLDFATADPEGLYVDEILFLSPAAAAVVAPEIFYRS